MITALIIIFVIALITLAILWYKRESLIRKAHFLTIRMVGYGESLDIPCRITNSTNGILTLFPLVEEMSYEKQTLLSEHVFNGFVIPTTVKTSQVTIRRMQLYFISQKPKEA